LLERSKPTLELVDLTEAELQDRAATPRGRLRISAPHGIGQTKLPMHMDAFLEHYPEVKIILVQTNRRSALATEGIDIALGIGTNGNENLVLRRLLLMDLTVCASPIYWKR